MCPTFCLAKVAEFKYNKGRSNTLYIFNILHFYIMQQRWSQHYLHFQYFKLLKLHMGREPAMSGIMRQRYISPHLCVYRKFSTWQIFLHISHMWYLQQMRGMPAMSKTSGIMRQRYISPHLCVYRKFSTWQIFLHISHMWYLQQIRGMPAMSKTSGIMRQRWSNISLPPIQTIPFKANAMSQLSLKVSHWNVQLKTQTLSVCRCECE